MSTKQKLHKLVDELPEEEIQPAELFLAYLREGRTDPLLLKLATAPWDDELETEEERLAVEEAKAELARGEGIPWPEEGPHEPEAEDEETHRAVARG